jgi:isopentenyl phosphate kinase
MGGGAAFGGGHAGAVRPHYMRNYGKANGYSEDWMASTKKTIEDELKSRGIDPVVISPVVSKVHEPRPMVAPIIALIAITALVCTLIFVVIWEIAQ